MNTKELIEVANSLELEYCNECPDYICLKGINGDASLLYTDMGYEKHKCLTIAATATLLDFKEHILQMGRDSLKMDLDILLNITKHG